MPKQPAKDSSLVRTSLQLPNSTLASINKQWPWLTQSEAIRMILNRYIYLDRDASIDRSSNIILIRWEKYIMKYVNSIELEVDSASFILIASRLPNIISEDNSEDENRPAVREMFQDLSMLNMMGRIKLLDYAVAKRKEAGF